MDRFALETPADLAANSARQSRLNRDEDGYYDNAAVAICENCGRTNVQLFEIDSLLVCDDCAEEQQRVEQAAAAIAALDIPCDARRRIIAVAQTANELLNRLRAHEMSGCALCGHGDRGNGREAA